MTSKPMQTSSDSQTQIPPVSEGDLTTERLIDAQVTFMQQWLSQKATPLMEQAWRWFGDQPLDKYLSRERLQRVVTDWLLNHSMSERMRADIRDVLHTVIYHPVNDDVPLSELIDDSQVQTLATYVGRHEQQRNVLIHTLVGNETFADLLTQTLYHAINDFMDSTLDKAGGVGKLMKLGRSSFEKATNKNLDEKLQAYLHRNIKELAQRAEANAKAHLSNDEVARLVISGWDRIKDQPISEIQTYLSDAPDNSSIEHIEANLQQSYDRLRVSPYLHRLVSAGIDTWYDNHQSDSMATVTASLHIDEQAITQVTAALAPLIQEALYQDWLTNSIREMLQAFYEQPHIKADVVLNRP